jgi:hypothetical protein
VPKSLRLRKKRYTFFFRFINLQTKLARAFSAEELAPAKKKIYLFFSFSKSTDETGAGI